MSQDETRTVVQVIGQNMRRIRDSRAVVLADVATSARDLGLTWDASAVSRIETGKRELTLEEFIALPLVMSLAVNEPITLVELLGLDEPATAGGALRNFNRRTNFANVLAVLAQPLFKLMAPDGSLKLDGEAINDAVRNFIDADKRRAQAAREPAEERDALRELREIADDLGVKPGEVATAIMNLWQGSSLLSHERESRLVKSGADLSRPASVRTMRGHITRQLMGELREYFESGRHRKAIKRGKGADDGSR